MSEAVFRIFDRQDWLRVNAARARIKVLIDKIGIDAFREQVEEELRGDWVNEREFDPAPLLFDYDEEVDRPRRPPPRTHSPNGDGAAFERFRASNVEPQRQAGFSSVQVRIVGAAISAQSSSEAWPRGSRAYSGGYASTTVGQNLLLRWVRNESLYEVWRALYELGLGDAGAGQIIDVVSCPGTDSCKLGITSSMGLNRAVRERVKPMQIDDPLTKRQIHIKIQAAPTAAASTTSPTSASTEPRSRSASTPSPPTWPTSAAASGRRGGLRHAAQGAPGRRAVPEAVERWLRMYEAEREQGEVFNAYAERVGATRFEDEARELGPPDRVEPREHEHISSTGSARSPSRWSGARANARSDGSCRRNAAARHRAAPPEARDGLLLPEGGDRADRHAHAHRAVGAGVHDRHRCALPRDIRGLARHRGPLPACRWR